MRQPRPMMLCPHCLEPAHWYTDLTTYETVLECSSEPDEHMQIRYSPMSTPEPHQVELFRRWEHELVMVGLSDLVGYQPGVVPSPQSGEVGTSQ